MAGIRVTGNAKGHGLRTTPGGAGIIVTTRSSSPGIALTSHRQVSMTEQEWLTSTDTPRMLAFASERSTNRNRWDKKLHLLEGEIIERQVRGPEAAALIRCVFANPFRPPPVTECPTCRGSGSVWVERESKPATAVWFNDAENVLALPPPDRNVCPACDGAGRVVGLPAAWLTPTVLAIATTISEERRFEETGVLADAMEESGMPPKEKCLDCNGTGTTVWPSEDGGSPLLVCDGCQGSGHVPNPLLTHLRGLDTPPLEEGWYVCEKCQVPFRPDRSKELACPVCRSEFVRKAGSSDRRSAVHCRGCHVLELILGK